MSAIIILESIITCPKCGHRKEKTMPTDASRFFYKCEKCQTLLKPVKGIAVYFAAMGQ